MVDIDEIQKSPILRLFTISTELKEYKYFPCVKYQIAQNRKIERLIDTAEVTPTIYTIYDGWDLTKFIKEIEIDALEILKWSRFNNKNRLILTILQTINWNNNPPNPITKIGLINIGNN